MGRFARLKPRRRKERDSGAVAVEFALILPVFLLLVFAVIDFGRMMNIQITLTEAAREGARTGAVTRSGPAGEARALLIANQGLGADLDGDDVVVRACPERYDDDAVAEATITFNFTYVTPLGALIGSSGYTMTGKGVMPCLH